MKKKVLSFALCMAMLMSVVAIPGTALALPGIWEESYSGWYSVRLDSPADLSSYKSGDTVTLKFSMRDYSNSYVSVYWRLAPMSAEGKTQADGYIQKDAAASFSASFKIPSNVPTGQYRLWIEVNDFGYGKEMPATLNTRLNITKPSSSGSSSGSYKKGWNKSGGKWYYYTSSSNYVRSNWRKVDGKWYYFDSSGVMQTGWKNINGADYFLSGSGAMYTGWKKSSGVWYYLAKSGKMVKADWVKSGKSWYYMDASGAMAQGWRTIGGKTYYLNGGTGKMLTGKWRSPDGQYVYHFNSSGQYTGWSYN